MAYFHLTDAGAGSKDGSDWDNAFDEPAFETWIEVSSNAGDVVWMKDGSYTMDSDINSSSRDGTALLPKVIIGVKAGTTSVSADVVYSDWAIDAADRPVIDGGAYKFQVGDYYVIRNIDIQAAGSHAIQLGSYCMVENCKVYNDYASGSAFRYGIYADIRSSIINSEAQSDTTSGIRAGQGSSICFSYIHDIATADRIGIECADHNPSILFNIIDNCVIGIEGGAKDGLVIVNNTIYGCGTAINSTDSNSCTILNNIIEGSTSYGFSWATQTDRNFFWNNHGDDTRNTDMWNNVDTSGTYQDYLVTSGDPLFTTPGSDFSLQSSSPNINAALSQALCVGTVGDNKLSQGAWQTEAGGGSPSGGGTVIQKSSSRFQLGLGNKTGFR